MAASVVDCSTMSGSAVKEPPLTLSAEVTSEDTALGTKSETDAGGATAIEGNNSHKELADSDATLQGTFEATLGTEESSLETTLKPAAAEEASQAKEAPGITKKMSSEPAPSPAKVRTPNKLCHARSADRPKASPAGPMLTRKSPKACTPRPSSPKTSKVSAASPVVSVRSPLVPARSPPVSARSPPLSARSAAVVAKSPKAIGRPMTAAAKTPIKSPVVEKKTTVVAKSPAMAKSPAAAKSAPAAQSPVAAARSPAAAKSVPAAQSPVAAARSPAVVKSPAVANSSTLAATSPAAAKPSTATESTEPTTSLAAATSPVADKTLSSPPVSDKAPPPLQELAEAPQEQKMSSEKKSPGRAASAPVAKTSAKVAAKAASKSISSAAQPRAAKAPGATSSVPGAAVSRATSAPAISKASHTKKKSTSGDSAKAAASKAPTTGADAASPVAPDAKASPLTPLDTSSKSRGIDERAGEKPTTSQEIVDGAVVETAAGHPAKTLQKPTKTETTSEIEKSNFKKIARTPRPAVTPAASTSSSKAPTQGSSARPTPKADAGKQERSTSKPRPKAAGSTLNPRPKVVAKTDQSKPSATPRVVTAKVAERLPSKAAPPKKPDQVCAKSEDNSVKPKTKAKSLTICSETRLTKTTRQRAPTPTRTGQTEAQHPSRGAPASIRAAASAPSLPDKQRPPASKTKEDKPKMSRSDASPRKALKKKLAASPQARARAASSPGPALSKTEAVSASSLAAPAKIIMATTASQCSDSDIALSLSAARALSMPSMPTTEQLKSSSAEVGPQSGGASKQEITRSVSDASTQKTTDVVSRGVCASGAPAADDSAADPHSDDELDSTTFISASELRKLIAQAKRHSANAIAEESAEEEEAGVLGS